MLATYRQEKRTARKVFSVEENGEVREKNDTNSVRVILSKV